MKKIIKENKYYILVLIIMFLLIYIKLPFYIEKPGGLINLSKKLKEDTTGSLNMTYVSSLRATPVFYFISKINKDWDLITSKEELGNGTEAEREFRGKLMLDEAYNTALLNALKLANKPIKINKQEVFVTYIYEEANTNLKVKDKIVKIDNIEINSKEDISNYINTLYEGKKIEIEVINDGKVEKRNANIIKYGDVLMIGIFCNTKYDIDTDIKLKFDKSETGPSGGMMLTLALYSKLSDIDLTNNKIISGTGTIDGDGKVGEIDGVKYKLKGAVNNKADVFLVPSGENYKEAIKEKEKNNYNIEIYEIKTIEDAIEILKS